MASMLSLANALARFAGAVRTLRGAVIAFAIGLGIPTVVAAAAWIGAQTSVYAWLAAHAPILAAVAGVHALLAIARRREHAKRSQARSWLVATPGFVAARTQAYVIQVAGPLLGQLMLAGIFIAVLRVGAGGTGLPKLLYWLAGGVALGAAMGTLWRRRAAEDRTEDSRYVPRARDRAHVPSLAGLSRWPVLQAIAWHRPENSRVLFLLAALSVPLGSSAILGLAIVAFWTLASYMTTLLRAVSHVGREAAAWLRATPIGFARFAWALSGRALVHQVIGTVLVGGTLSLVGTPLPTVARLGAAWLAIVVLVSAVALAEAYRARPATLRIVMYASATLAAEYRAHGWAFPIAVLLAAVQVRGAIQHARS
jgi:hypothetical protein